MKKRSRSYTISETRHYEVKGTSMYDALEKFKNTVGPVFTIEYRSIVDESTGEEIFDIS